MYVINTILTGEVGIKPRIIRIWSTDTYAAITAAGYLSNAAIQANPIQPTDFVEMNYNGNPPTSFGVFVPSISNGVITLRPWSNENFLLTTTNETDYQQMLSVKNVINISAGTWTVTRIAEGNYVYRHTAAADTSIIGVDITPAIRTAAGRGFELASVDVIYSIGTLAINAHSLTIDKISYANNVAVAITSVPLTGTLATATQTNPYVSNIAVTTPAFLVTSDSKYIAELTVNAAATSAYDYYGMNLKFTKSVA